jgi:ribonuclease R
MNGDLVGVTLARNRGSEPRAYVQGVLQRAVTTFLGTFGVAGPLGVVVPLDERIRRDFFVLPDDASAEREGVGEGDVCVARILTYPTRNEAGIVTVERRVGASAELDMGVEGVIASYDLPSRFPDRVAEQADSIVADVAGALASEPGRKDLRDVPCVTIDPASARDFDDAVSCERTADGGYELGVHIADVTHYLGWDTPADVEARARTCSVYLVDRVIPMLPERLCDDVCSLMPDSDRLAMSVTMRLTATGEVVSAEASTSAIHSVARLDYDLVQDLLEGSATAVDLPCSDSVRETVATELALLDELAQKRVRVRARRGAIDFDTQEAKVTLDAEGHPVGVEVREKTRATSLVEEAMLLANESVARMLADSETPAAFRVHEQPSPDTLATTLPILRELGIAQGDQLERIHAGDPFAIQDALARAAGTDGEYLAETLLLRAMKRAVYLPTNQGHYALAATAYCHFTSPIRRYPDVIVHRALKALLTRRVEAPSSKGGVREQSALLPQLCRTCSERERVADAAARASQKVKMAELYLDHVGERFAGMVVGCERFGLFVRLDDTCAEGLVPVRSMGEEWFSFDEEHLSLTGESSGRSWRPGRRVVVTVTGCKPVRGQIDFALVDDTTAPGSYGMDPATPSSSLGTSRNGTR